MRHDEIDPNDYDGGAAIMARKIGSGTYEISGSAEVEAWDRVMESIGGSDMVERIDHLNGWGIWTEVWTVYPGGDDSTNPVWYFRAPSVTAYSGLAAGQKN